ncbi:alpha-1,4-N-acetylglucosaminyltransferase-like [Hemiscyllium ocellatum]|uniref:alpha-1,4-N-acetylglucosaminyltransferase-like n=1 Tax=Hemiscyllium ocellatum TaxID=170820 RepID=UPI0029671830|nr:alpha-1,4-N-acetylglucosaminyltransferase-like [Hemiscyllium ocellatum]
MIVKGPHPTTEPGIIFLQTSSELNPKPLVMCSIESAARLNPNKPVYFFMKAFTGNVSAFWEPEYKAIPLLSSFKNVIILPLNPQELFHNTPLAGWYEKVDPSKEVHWIHVLSDGCRLVLLWKYGGIYLDTDTISLKPLEFRNFIVAESANYASNGILGFNRSHPFLENCLTDFVEKYNGAVWGQQGPTLITRNLKKWCGTDLLDQFLNKECKGIGPAKYPVMSWHQKPPFTGHIVEGKPKRNVSQGTQLARLAPATTQGHPRLENLFTSLITARKQLTLNLLVRVFSLHTFCLMEGVVGDHYRGGSR